MNSVLAAEAPSYRLFAATWGAFDPQSELPPLTQTAGNATALHTSLESIGALRGEPHLLHDVDGPRCIDDLDRFLAEDGDIILYLASHGLVPSGSTQFFRLATGDTRDLDDMTRSLVIAEVIDRVSRHSGGRKLVVIDACYSGKVGGTVFSRGSLDVDLPGDMCVLVATDPYTAADARTDDALTAFTGALAEVLVTGLNRRGPQLTVRTIFSRLQEVATEREMPKPWLLATGNAAETISFRNAAGGDYEGHAFVENLLAFEHRTEILYVDDQEQRREDFRTELEKAGHHVTVAGGPIEGVDALEAGHFDIVVVDLLLEGDTPAIDFIGRCNRRTQDSLLFLVSRRDKSSQENWERLDAIFQFPSRISAFLWKPAYLRTIEQHANRIRAERRHTLSHLDGLPDSVALVAERMIARDEELGARSERLRLEIRTCVERLVARWFPHQPDEEVYIDRMSMEVVDGGRSSSVVFTLSPVLRGIEPESVTPLILKLGPREEIEEEVRRYDRYVQVGIPLDFRTDKIASSLVGGVGGLIYSFRGAEDNAIRDVSQLSDEEILECLEQLFGKNTPKRWYGSHGTGSGISPTEHFVHLGYPEERWAKTLEKLRRTLAKNIHGLPEDSPAASERLEPAYQEMTQRHDATLVHGDLTLENLVKVSDSRFAVIDYRTVGLGPRLIDFATLEIACWMLAASPPMPRSERYLVGHVAIPRTLRPVGFDPDLPDWLEDPARLARRCRELAVENHEKATDREYGSLLWLAALRISEFRSRPLSSTERNTQQAFLPAIALAAQAMIDSFAS